MVKRVQDKYKFLQAVLQGYLHEGTHLEAHFPLLKQKKVFIWPLELS